jgi:hypothetical protein
MADGQHEGQPTQPTRPKGIDSEAGEPGLDALVTVYVPLLREGVDVWRPVAATRQGESMFRLIASQPEDEVWCFPPGSIVRCEQRGSDLVAVALPDEPTPTQQTQPKGIDPKTGKPFEPVEIPVPKRGDWAHIVRRASNPSQGP